MRRPALTVAILVAATAAAGVLAGPAQAGPEAPSSTGAASATRPARPASIPAGLAGYVPLALRPGRMVTVSLELRAAPVAARLGERFVAGSDRSAAAERSVAAGQRPVVDAVRDRGGVIVRRMQTAVNALVVRVPQAEIAALSRIPGVARVVPSRVVTLENTDADRYTGVAGAWARTPDPDFTGAGRTIAIIDTGIDYYHRDFAGTAGSDADPTSRDGEFPTGKVVEGQDLVGENYSPDGDGIHDVPEPDADPVDCQGHGTHVAGTAAGTGVNSDGTTYTGAYDATLLSGGTLDIGPGTAPDASLLAYKVFGCDGATLDSDIAAAIDMAVSDGADVISMSLGSTYGSGAGVDISAVNTAVAAGVVVVAAAGNDGHGAFTVGSPASASQTIAVAALDARSTSGTFKQPASFTSAGPRGPDNVSKPDVAAPGVDIRSAAAGTGDGSVVFDGTSMATPHVAGVAALALQANPTWTPEQVKSAIMNTATAGTSKVASYNSLLLGSGLVQPTKVVDTSVIALTTAGRGSLSFGYDPLSASYSEEQTVTLQNHGSTSATYDFATANEGGGIIPPAITITITPTTVTIPSGATRAITVRVSLSAAKVRGLPAATASDQGRLRVARGVIRGVATDDGSNGHYVIRVPYLAVPRGLSSIGSTTPTLDANGSGSIRVRNGGIHRGDAELFAVGATETTAGSGTSTDLRAVGIDILPGSAMQPDLPAGQRTVTFAVNTHGRWANPGENEIVVEVNTDTDEAAERVITAIDSGFGDNDSATGEYIVLVFNGSGTLLDAWTPIAPMNSSVALLAVSSANLGVSSSNNKWFRYRVTMTSLVGRTPSDTMPNAGWSKRFRVFSPPQRTGSFAVLDQDEAATMSLTSSNTDPRWMLISPDDNSGPAQATIVTPS